MLIFDVANATFIYCDAPAGALFRLPDDLPVSRLMAFLAHLPVEKSLSLPEANLASAIYQTLKLKQLYVTVLVGAKQTQQRISAQMENIQFQGRNYVKIQAQQLPENNVANAFTAVQSKRWDREKLYSLLFEQAKVGVVLRDFNTGEIFEVNDRYLALIGLERSDVGNFTFKAISHPEDQQKQDQLEAKMKAGLLREFSIEKRYLKKDGTSVWALETCSAIWLPGEAPKQIIAIAQDINQSKKIELALRFVADKQWTEDGNDFLLGLCHHLRDLLYVSTALIAIPELSDDRTLKIMAISSASADENPLSTLELSKDIWQTDSATPFIQGNCQGVKIAGSRQTYQQTAGVWLYNRESQRHGLILLLHQGPFTQTTIMTALLTVLSTSVESELVRRRSEQLIWRQANYDILTNVPNRRLLNDRLHHEIQLAKRQNTKTALLFLDLDNFKEINDSLGHHTGDKLLKMVATRIRSCVREVDTVARFGGDEFAILVSNVRRNDYLVTVAQKILNELSLPFQIAEHRLITSCSIGITVYPDDSASAEDIVTHADQAMYLAKSNGKNRYSFFTLALNETVQRRAKLTRDLHQALSRHELYLEYQPIFDMTLQRFTKAEALLRWQHPELGRINPDEFIKIAEETGLIHKIGDWVFESVVAVAKSLRQILDADFQISLNKSPVQFRQQVASRSHQIWCDIIAYHQLDGDAIIVEMTESTFIEDSQEVMVSLKMLRECGMQTAIDDFGTGHSAMAYLRRYEIDYLKIDKEFVQSMSANSKDYMLCHAITVMAHNLGMSVVAEGVETQEQLNLLHMAGADYVQGYLLSRPVSLEALSALVQQTQQTAV